MLETVIVAVIHQTPSRILKALPLKNDSTQRCIDETSINKDKFSMKSDETTVTDNKAFQWHIFPSLITILNCKKTCYWQILKKLAELEHLFLLL